MVVFGSESDESLSHAICAADTWLKPTIAKGTASAMVIFRMMRLL
jgi:hypothetical protein